MVFHQFAPVPPEIEADPPDAPDNGAEVPAPSIPRQVAAPDERRALSSPQLQLLLVPGRDPLTTVRLGRLQLHRRCPSTELVLHGGEAVLYPLLGTVDAVVETDSAAYCAGWLGGRDGIFSPPTNCLRLVPGVVGEMRVRLTVLLERHPTADLLVLHTTQSPRTVPLTGAVMLQHVYQRHTVGQGTHQRLVTEFDTPQGYLWQVGETVQEPGMTSSWPPHATPDDMDRYLKGAGGTWEEVFWCAGIGTATLDGLYSTGELVQKPMTIEHGGAYVMPLGNHRMTAAPDSRLFYLWGYVGTALTKTYNQWATDIKSYVK